MFPRRAAKSDRGKSAGAFHPWAGPFSAEKELGHAAIYPYRLVFVLSTCACCAIGSEFWGIDSRRGENQQAAEDFKRRWNAAAHQ